MSGITGDDLLTADRAGTLAVGTDTGDRTWSLAAQTHAVGRRSQIMDLLDSGWNVYSIFVHAGDDDDM